MMEDTTEKVSPNCGETENIEQSAKVPGFYEKNKKNILIGVIAVAAILAVLFIVNAVQASNLKKELMRDWYKVEGEEGSYILCVLDFSDKEVEYRLETGYVWMDTTIATFDYKAISGNKIKVLRYGDDWETITIEFNDDKTVMTASPALTSVDNTEFWVNLDQGIVCFLENAKNVYLVKRQVVANRNLVLQSVDVFDADQDEDINNKFPSDAFLKSCIIWYFTVFEENKD